MHVPHLVPNTSNSVEPHLPRADTPTVDYTELKWTEANIVRVNDFTIKYEKSTEKLYFFRNDQMVENVNKTQVLKCIPDPAKCQIRIFLEWCNKAQNGQYFYYNLYKILSTSTNDFDYIDINTSLIPTRSDFNEAQVESQIDRNDIVILSPLRCLLEWYSNMGTFHGHNLFLGPTPTSEFLSQRQVLMVFNCGLKCNDTDLMTSNKVVEKLFSVAEYKNVLNYKYDLRDENLELIEQKANVRYNDARRNIGDGLMRGGNMEKHEIEIETVQYLDKMINLIDNYLKFGNVLIHCVAGVHRSPLITACYMLKYSRPKGVSLMSSTAYSDIYREMMKVRPSVDGVTFPIFLEWFDEYRLYLIRNNNTRPCCGCSIL